MLFLTFHLKISLLIDGVKPNCGVWKTPALLLNPIRRHLYQTTIVILNPTRLLRRGEGSPVSQLIF